MINKIFHMSYLYFGSNLSKNLDFREFISAKTQLSKKSYQEI